MIKTVLVPLLSLLVFFGNGSGSLLTGLYKNVRKANTGIIEKLIVASGSVTMNLQLNRLNGYGAKDLSPTSLNFDVERDSFFTVLVFNNELRGPLPSSMPLIPRNAVSLPARLDASIGQLVVENKPFGSEFEFVISDSKTGFVFFNIEGHQFDYNPSGRLLSVQAARLLLSKEFAAELGRSSEAGTFIGEISLTAAMRPIEITQIVDGDVVSDVLPASPQPGTVPGPDVVVGDLAGLAQFGSSSGTQVGLAVGTDSCNFGTVDLNWFALPNNDHPVIPQNLYRMSGGQTNDERFEQIGQSHVKHAFTALTQNLCGLGCNGVGGSRLGSGCSDPYSASLNAGPNLGSRAWINPFSGAYPRGDSATPPNNHAGHTHTGPSHRILTEIRDLSTSMNQGATYYAEAQYVTPHEYQWCRSNPSQCNMYNNVSYRRYNVTGTGSPFSFSPVGATVRAKPAVSAWTGATLVEIKPDPGNDGIGTVAYKVTNTSPGVWHYEYAIYNQNIDRAIQSFSVALGAGANLSNIGFHAPPQHPGWANDGTAGSAGYSNAPWTQTQSAGAMTWNTESFAQNPNANAIRWGTMYNFRFDSNRPPQTANATIGFFKTGEPINVQIQGPSAAPAATRFDFDGDRKADISVFRPSDGVWYMLGSQAGFSATQFGISTDKLTPADYDGDGKTDIAVYRSGVWYLLRSSAGFTAYQFGLADDIPQPADFDGDGRAELAVYRPSDGVWYVLNLHNGQFTAAQFGISTDKPVVADYDGDGKANYAVFRPSNGTWYIARSTGTPSQNFDAVSFGLNGDLPVPADFDGDGKTDKAVYRPSDGVWYLLRSQTGFTAIQFGISTDLPAPADFDGDGRADITVFRNGVWYQLLSTSGFSAMQFGTTNDKAVPNAFVR